MKLDREHSIEIAFLAIATIYSLTLPLKHSVTLFDSVILVTIFVLYTVRVSRAPAEEPHLVGPARYLGTFSTVARRTTVITIAVFAAALILMSAEHFAEALVASGETLGVSEFLLVQWIAPLASEAPELLVAGLYAWRLNTSAGLGHAGQLQGEPVDLAGGHAADRVRGGGRRIPRIAARHRAARGAVPHGGAVVLRRGGDLEPVDVAARGRHPVRAVLVPVPVGRASSPSPSTGWSGSASASCI